MSWDVVPIALAIVAIVLSWSEQPRWASIAGYCSVLASQLGRLRYLRPNRRKAFPSRVR